MHYIRHHRRNFVLLFMLIVVGWGMFSRYFAYSDLSRQAGYHMVPSVVAITASPGNAEESVTLPANVQAWHEAPVFARTNGYLKRWVTDIGAKVKAGDLIAEIDAPEVDAALHQAQADLHTAEANNVLAQVTAKRWVALLKTESVSKQEVDEKVGDAKAKAALLAAARANVDRLSELESFKRITAPFDGTITARNVDDGALISAGSPASARELFHIADMHKLRVYVQVPQNYAVSVRPGFTAQVHFSEYPDKSFTAKLMSTAGAIDPVTRTLMLEFELDNQGGRLMSGSYAEVHLKLSIGNSSIMLPVNVLLFRSGGLKVASVRDDNRVTLKPVSIYKDFGDRFEVRTGIREGEKIIVNPPDSLENGQEVHVLPPTSVKGTKP